MKLENKEHGISDTDGEPETIEYMPAKPLKNHKSTANIVRNSKSSYSNSMMHKESLLNQKLKKNLN
jgi:hypothetical protein